MQDLLNKYISNRLSNKESVALRSLINTATDKELEPYLLELWKKETGQAVEQDILNELKCRIDQVNARTTRNFNKTWRKLAGIAAAVLLPLFATFLYVMIEKAPVHSTNDMTVYVGSGERSTVILPDGTKINLNSETLLTYDTHSFNRKLREIRLDGEAYFQVAKNKKKPFVIQTNHLQVEILGTEFNLRTRKDELITEVNLVKGKVALTNPQMPEHTVILVANHRAIFNENTGLINIDKIDSLNAAPWLRGELTFYATPIQTVLKEIERSYGINFTMTHSEIITNDLFTGTFSTINLHETLEILKMHYKFNYIIKGKSVIIENFKVNKRSI
ncbi:MAG: FecR family protein [Pigmentiphaga sp.]|nr:FecR family protein [Pigmentiphaga sp.]